MPVNKPIRSIPNTAQQLEIFITELSERRESLVGAGRHMAAAATAGGGEDLYADVQGVRMCLAQTEAKTVNGEPGKKVLVTATGSHYELVRTLRKCIYGKVKHAVRLVERDGALLRIEPFQHVAIKIISRAMLDEGRLAENPMVELRVQQRLADPGHGNVLGIVDVVFDATYVYAVLPYCNGGELYSLVEERGAMTQPQARHFFGQIARGLRYLHTHAVCHRDMSLENVLLHGPEGADACGASTEALIIDFGLCIAPVPLAEDGATALPMQSGPRAGKLTYMAPEVYIPQGTFLPFAIDMWCMGVMLFIMCTGAPPYEQPHPGDPRFALIVAGRLDNLLLQWGFDHLPPSVVGTLLLLAGAVAALATPLPSAACLHSCMLTLCLPSLHHSHPQT